MFIFVCKTLTIKCKRKFLKKYAQKFWRFQKTPYLCSAFQNNGEMAEWSIAAVLKTVEGNTSGGSNPSFSASFFTNPPHSGHSAVRLAYLLWEQRVVSSNLTAPTNFELQSSPVFLA